jgi:hypothetical protein
MSFTILELLCPSVTNLRFSEHKLDYSPKKVEVQWGIFLLLCRDFPTHGLNIISGDTSNHSQVNR